MISAKQARATSIQTQKELEKKETEKQAQIIHKLIVDAVNRGLLKTLLLEDDTNGKIALSNIEMLKSHRYEIRPYKLHGQEIGIYVSW